MLGKERRLLLSEVRSSMSNENGSVPSLPSTEWSLVVGIEVPESLPTDEVVVDGSYDVSIHVV